MFTILGALIFITGYALITLEHKFHTSKSAIALLMGGFLWLLVAAQGGEHFSEAIKHAGTEIFDIVIFLLAAMSLVEVLVHYQFFDVMRGKIFALGLDEKKQFLVICGLAFFLSAILDNLTTTIVMIQIARKFFKGENLLRTGAAIVLCANAGGAFSPIGDVTTIMLWLADKFEAGEVIARGFLPSLSMFLVSTALMYRHIVPSEYDSKEEVITKLTQSEKVVVTLTFASFALPIIMGFIGLPPYIGLLIGLGIVWLVVDIFKKFSPRTTHLEASIEEFMQKADISSLKFFIGILLAVSALQHLHLLEYVSQVMYGASPDFWRIVTGNVGLGLLSAILDNVPLTALAMEILHTSNTSLWVLLALTVGTGGSLLIIGSAAGVVVMGMLKELSFSKYFQMAFVPVLISYFVGVGVWLAQYFILGPLS